MEDFVNYVTYRGIDLMPYDPLVKDLDQRMEYIKCFKPKEGDVLLSTFPKSGTHWIFEVLCMLSRGNAKYIGTEPEDHFMEIVDEVESLDNLESPRILISHLPYKFLPESISDGKLKIVHVVRNPRDVFVSFYHYLMSSSNANLSWEKYIENILEDKIKPFGGWFAYEREFEEAMKNNDFSIHTIYYEDMCENPLKGLKGLANFLEVDTNEDTLKDIATKCSFNNLKMHYESGAKSREKFNEWANTMSYILQPPAIFRKGKTGDWKTMFTVAQNEKFLEVFQRKMKDSKLLKYL